jgi:uncharacterized protein (DUF58 family)
LLAAADQLAASVQTGEHGRRRSGFGDEFWQYRQAVDGDAHRDIDWRRSARSDVQFIRQKEWQATQSVAFWVDVSQNMQFTSSSKHPAKAYTARLLALAVAVLLQRGGERISLVGDPTPATTSRNGLARIAHTLSAAQDVNEFGRPDLTALAGSSQAVAISDFLTDPTELIEQIEGASARGIRGAMVQVLDPQEVTFPFQGRNVFESPLGKIRHETLKAGGLQRRYMARLEERQALLRDLARRVGWQFMVHQIDQATLPTLLWLYRSLREGR